MNKYYLLIALLIVSIITALYFINKTIKYRKALLKGIDNNNHLKKTINVKNQELFEKNAEHNKYMQSVQQNFHELLPYGEREVLRYLCRMLTTPQYSEWTVYTHLEYRLDNGKYKQVDFLVVGDKGMYVIESKAWKGLTLLYSKDYKSPFYNTQFNNFGNGCNGKLSVFNINNNTDTFGDLKITTYNNNPVAQARGYSKDLSNILGCKINNIVVFHSNDEYEVKYNDSYFEKIKPLGEYTTITNQNNLIQFFDSQTIKNFDYENIKKIIEEKCEYYFSLDKNNLTQSPLNIYIK